MAQRMLDERRAVEALVEMFEQGRPVERERPRVRPREDVEVDVELARPRQRARVAAPPPTTTRNFPPRPGSMPFAMRFMGPMVVFKMPDNSAWPAESARRFLPTAMQFVEPLLHRADVRTRIGAETSNHSLLLLFDHITPSARPAVQRALVQIVNLWSGRDVEESMPMCRRPREPSDAFLSSTAPVQTPAVALARPGFYSLRGFLGDAINVNRSDTNGNTFKLMRQYSPSDGDCLPTSRIVRLLDLMLTAPAGIVARYLIQSAPSGDTHYLREYADSNQVGQDNYAFVSSIVSIASPAVGSRHDTSGVSAVRIQ